MHSSLQSERRSAEGMQRDSFSTSGAAGLSESPSARTVVIPQPSKTLGRAAQREILPARRLNVEGIKPEVLLARDFTAEQEKLVYFPVERYRLLATRLAQVSRNLGSKVFLITSAIAEEGKTLTTANLAFALSGASATRTLVVDLDLRRPSLASTLGVRSGNGESPFLQEGDWHEGLWELRPNLHALLLTGPVNRPEEAIQGPVVKRMLEEARAEYDLIIVDSAPLLLAVDTHVLLAMIDHAVLVVRADHTPINCSQDAVKMLGEKGLGCIFNDVKKMKYEEYYRAYYK